MQGSSSGSAVYIETQTPISNANGLVTIEIGGGTVISGTFSGFDWSNGTYFIETETDPAGGTSYYITSIIQLLSVPYDLYYKISENATELESQIAIMQNALVNDGAMEKDIDGNVYGIIRVGYNIGCRKT